MLDCGACSKFQVHQPHGRFRATDFKTSLGGGNQDKAAIDNGWPAADSKQRDAGPMGSCVAALQIKYAQDACRTVARVSKAHALQAMVASGPSCSNSLSGGIKTELQKYYVLLLPCPPKNLWEMITMEVFGEPQKHGGVNVMWDCCERFKIS